MNKNMHEFENITKKFVIWGGMQSYYFNMWKDMNIEYDDLSRVYFSDEIANMDGIFSNIVTKIMNEVKYSDE